MNVSRVAVLIIAVAIVASQADETNNIVQVANRSFTNATITSDGVFVKVVSSTGIEKFRISQMTTNEQVRWHYNSAAAAIQAKQAAAADAAFNANLAKQNATINAANEAKAKADEAAYASKRKAEETSAAYKETLRKLAGQGRLDGAAIDAVRDAFTPQ